MSSLIGIGSSAYMNVGLNLYHGFGRNCRQYHLNSRGLFSYSRLSRNCTMKRVATGISQTAIIHERIIQSTDHLWNISALHTESPHMNDMVPQSPADEANKVQAYRKKSKLLPVKLPTIQQHPQEPETDIQALPSERRERRKLELQQNILSCSDIHSLLYYYAQNKCEFETPEYLLIVEKLADCQNEGTSSGLTNMNEFSNICFAIWKLCSTLEAEEVLMLYKCFQNIGIRTDTLLMQSLLQMMRHQINLLDIKDLLFMKRMLFRTSPCKLKMALNKAIPKVLENHIKSYISPKLQIHELIQLLEICIKGRVERTDRILHLIYQRKLNDIFHSETQYYATSLLALIWNLLDLLLVKNRHNIIKPSEKIDEIIDILLNNATEELVTKNGIYSLNKTQILALTRKFENVYSKGYDIAVRENYLEKVAHIARTWDLRSISDMLSSQFAMHYIDEELVDQVMDHLDKSSNTEDIKEVKPLPLLSAITSIVSMNHKCTPEFIERLLSQPHTPKPETDIGVPWIKVVLNLMAVNYFPEKLLETILHEEYLKKYLAFRSYAKIEYLDLLRLHQAVKFFWQNTSVEVPEDILLTAKETQESKAPSPILSESLKLILGSNCVGSRVFTPNMAVIDHLIFLDERMNPLALQNVNSSPLRLADVIPVAKNLMKHKIAIFEVPNSWIYQPGLNIRGYFRIELDIIQKELNMYDESTTTLIPIYEKEIADLEASQYPQFLTEKMKHLVAFS